MAGTCLFSSAVLTSHTMLWGSTRTAEAQPCRLAVRGKRCRPSWSLADGLYSTTWESVGRVASNANVLGMERCAWVMVRGVEEGWRIVIALLRLPRAWWRIPRPKRSGGFGLIAVFLTEQQLGSVKSRVSISRQPRRGMPR